MKPFFTSLILSLIVIFIIIYLNDKVLGKKIKNQNNKKEISAINLRKDNNHIMEKRLKTKHGKQSKIKLSTQLVKAKKICWSGQHISQRIIGGTNAPKDTMPWIAAIFVVNKKGWKLQCGAAIVSTKFVLTAAHCFWGKSPKPTDYVVRCGAHDLTSKNHVIGTIVEIHKHPKFKMGHNDIALVLLKNEIKYNDVISPICVPGLTTPSFWDTWAKGDPVLISGWGVYDNRKNSTGKIATEVKKGFAHLVNNSLCKVMFLTHFDLITNLCLGSKESKNQICVGDSGGPVIPLVYVEGKESFVFPVVIGIVSIGSRFCTGPSLLTKVESFTDWINKVTSKISY